MSIDQNMASQQMSNAQKSDKLEKIEQPCRMHDKLRQRIQVRMNKNKYTTKAPQNENTSNYNLCSTKAQIYESSNVTHQEETGK